MVLAAAVPEWKCLNDTISENLNESNSWTSIANVSLVKTCEVNGKPCRQFEFGENINTMVSEVGTSVIGEHKLITA